MVFTWTVALATAGILAAPVTGPATASVEATFVPVGSAPTGAVTYDLTRVPAGAHIEVASLLNASGSAVSVRVSGLLPDRVYGAHVHRYGCGATPEAAGPHVQDVPDPVQPSVDPAYANPHNEIWLDFTTDAQGNARSGSQVEWKIPRGGAGSVVVHEHATHTDAGEAGTAGGRLACVSVAFNGT